MTVEQNIELCRRFVEDVFNKGNIQKVDDYMAPNFQEREQLPPGIPAGREGVKQLVTMMRSAFPDFKGTINDIIADGDKVVVYWTWSGTHKGELMGIPPSGKQASWQVMDLIRISNGKLVEHWGVMDMMALMQQLGAVPAQGGR